MTAGIMIVENQTVTSELTMALEQLERKIAQNAGILHKIAVFDLDNTLLVGDIGEAVLANLLLREYPIGISLDEYTSLLAHDKPEAYRRAVSAMKGMSPLTVEEVTLSTIYKQADHLMIGNDAVPVPHAHPVMREFIRLLQWQGYRTLIVSASNQISVRIVARELFGIPVEDAFGIAPVVEDNVITGSLVEPMPVWTGKVDVVKQVLGSVAPLITAGDSSLDLPMMRMCDERGFSIWVGDDEAAARGIRSRYTKPHHIVFVPHTSFFPL